MSVTTFDFSSLRPIDRYKILCGVVVPRPIAFVTTLNEDRSVNAAPFSFFNVFSEDPAQIVLGLQHKSDGERKDTTRNIAREGDFVVNMVDEALAEKMNLAATDFPYGTSETANLELETAPSLKVPTPRLVAAPVSLECRRSVSLAFTNTRELLIGEVLAVHIREGLIDPGSLYVDETVYRPIGRLAGSSYCRQGPTFALKRVGFADWRRKSG